jgi:hypothetical protein
MASSVEVEELGVQELGEGKDEPAPTSVTVLVSPSAPKVPEPSIKVLLPTMVKKLTAKYVANNGGKQPTVRDNIEIKRLAVIAAAKKINDDQQAKDALQEAKRKMKRTHTQLEHDFKVVAKTEQNIDYAARKAYIRADAKVKKIGNNYHKQLDKTQAMEEKDKMLKLSDHNAVTDRKYIGKQIQKYKKMNKKAQADEEKSSDYVYKARALEKKTLAL